MAKTRSQVLTGSGNWTPPAGVGCVWVTLIGGGSAGACGRNNPTGWGSGGGAGEHLVQQPYAVTPGVDVAYSVGAGGVGTESIVTFNGGGDTTFGTLLARGAPTMSFPQRGTAQPGFGGGPGGGQSVQGYGGYGPPGTMEGLMYVGGAEGGNPAALNPEVALTGSGAGSYPLGGVQGINNGPRSGGGASTILGRGADGALQDTVGTNATTPGAGGGGGGGITAPPLVRAGGNGADGYCCVFWLA